MQRLLLRNATSCSHLLPHTAAQIRFVYLTVLIARSGFELVYANEMRSTSHSQQRHDYYLPTDRHDIQANGNIHPWGGSTCRDKSTESSQLLKSLEGAKAYILLLFVCGRNRTDRHCKRIICLRHWESCSFNSIRAFSSQSADLLSGRAG